MTSGESHRRYSARSGRGFTLIELVVVMTLIGLLLSIAAPRFLGSIDKGRENVRRQNIAALRGAIDQFRADSGRYPETLDELVARRADKLQELATELSALGVERARSMVASIVHAPCRRGFATARVARGGSWYYPPQDLRSAFRDWFIASNKVYDRGFRLVRSLNP